MNVATGTLTSSRELRGDAFVVGRRALTGDGAAVFGRQQVDLLTTSATSSVSISTVAVLITAVERPSCRSTSAGALAGSSPADSWSASAAALVDAVRVRAVAQPASSDVMPPPSLPPLGSTVVGAEPDEEQLARASAVTSSDNGETCPRLRVGRRFEAHVGGTLPWLGAVPAGVDTKWSRWFARLVA